MKKIYVKSAFMFSVILSLAICAAGSNKSKDPGASRAGMRNIGPVATPSILSFGTDVVMRAATENQQDIRIATAFNGWVFSVFTTHGGSSDGLRVLRSKDNGLTWDTLLHYTGNYYSSDIVVCGNDTNALYFYLSSVLHNGSTYIYWVDRNDATAGVYLSEPVNENIPDSIYDVALAQDFNYPAYNATGFTVEALYSKHGSSADSIIANLSMDGGVTFANRKVVDYTSSGFGKVSVAYGYSNVYSNGRYFAAYEEHTPGNIYGHVKECYTGMEVDDIFTTPVYLDSLFTVPVDWANHAAYPVISVQSSAATNDSGGLSALVVWESQFNGTADIDAVGEFTYYAVGGSASSWIYCYPDYSATTHAKEPDVSYDETMNNFLVTFWDSTDNALNLDVKNFNMPIPAPVSLAWPVTSMQYNDQVGTLVRPFPRVAARPASIDAAQCAWGEIRSGFRTALFDADNTLLGEQHLPASAFGLSQNYPNPASSYTTISLSLLKTESVVLELFDLLGNRICTLQNGTLEAGSYSFRQDVSNLPAGYYTYTLRTATGQVTRKLLVAH